MSLGVWLGIGSGLVVFVIGLLIAALQNQRRRVRRIRQRFREIESGELRMFAFLTELGHAIEHDPSLSELSRIIVDGMHRVIGAEGGGIYLLAGDPTYLVPAYISDDCPPLIGVPLEIRERAEVDPKALESHIRLSRVELDEGILGHCLAVGEPVHIADVKSHATFRDACTEFTGDVGAMLAPLRHAGKDLGVLVIVRQHVDGAFSRNDFSVFRAVAEQASFAIGNARLHRDAHEKRVIETDLRNAREVQRVLLPQQDPYVSGFRISGTNLPAQIISGDYYDYFRTGEDQFGVVVADVSGKGVSAGLLMAMCRSVLRSVVQESPSPSAAVAAVNRQLFPDIREDMFISMMYAVLDESSGTMTFARAGHDPALHFQRATGTVVELRAPGLALGIDAGSVFERVTRDHSVILEKGDCVLFYTDGAREATDEQGDEFGLERLSEVFRSAAPLGAEAVLHRLQEAVTQFAGEGPQMDDITLVAIEKR